MSEREYVLGTDQEELERLGLQHRVWRAEAWEHWMRAGFRPGGRALDAGCGPGFATVDLAELMGREGSVVAVDASRRFLDRVDAVARRDGLARVETLEADLQALALEPGSIDFAWNRWVFSFVKDPDAMVANVARALKKGGVWAIQEYVAYSSMKLGPEGEALPRVVAAIHQSWRAQGGEPDVGLVLPRLLERNGLEVVEARPITKIARPGTFVWEWPESFFVNFVPRLAQSGFLSTEDAEKFLDEWRVHSERKDSIFVAPTVVALTAVKL